MADRDGNIVSNGGKLNVPEARELATTKGARHIGRIFVNRWIDGWHEFSTVWVTTLLQRDVAGAEEATITIAEVAEDDRAGEDKVKNRQADKLL